MSALKAEDFEELRAVIEDGTMRFDASDPDWLVLTIAPGCQVSWALSGVVDDVIDTIETFGQMDGARELGEYLERLGRRIKKTVNDMEAS